MTGRKAALGVSVLALVVAHSASAAQGIREGKWSMTTTMRMGGMDDQAAEAMREMENMPPDQRAMMEQMMGGMRLGGGPGGGPGMSTTTTQCITNDNPVPEGRDEADCRKTHTMKGNTVEFEVVCEDSRSTGRVTYQNDSMQGTIQSSHTERGQPQQMTIDISGEYIGPCS